MITQERKSKYKHKITITPSWSESEPQHHEIKAWCEETFGPGGRSKKFRWRFGWTDNADTYYFKSSKDAMMFALRWSS